MLWPPKRKSSPTSQRNQQKLNEEAVGSGEAVLPDPDAKEMGLDLSGNQSIELGEGGNQGLSP